MLFHLYRSEVGAEHEDMLARTDGYMTVWMLYQLYGDEEAGQALIGENAEILSNANWQDIERNKQPLCFRCLYEKSHATHSHRKTLHFPGCAEILSNANWQDIEKNQ